MVPCWIGACSYRSIRSSADGLSRRTRPRLFELVQVRPTADAICKMEPDLEAGKLAFQLATPACPPVPAERWHRVRREPLRLMLLDRLPWRVRFALECSVRMLSTVFRGRRSRSGVGVEGFSTGRPSLTTCAAHYFTSWATQTFPSGLMRLITKLLKFKTLEVQNIRI